MNGDGKSETGPSAAAAEEDEELVSRKMVYMWGYLPGASPQRSPLLSPAVVKISPAVESSWKDVSGGGCGFAMATSGSLSVYPGFVNSETVCSHSALAMYLSDCRIVQSRIIGFCVFDYFELFWFGLC